MKRKSSYHHGDLRSALIDATVALVAEEGVEGVTLRKVARAAGVTAPAAYHHFSSKDHLLVAGAEQGFQGWLSALSQLPDEGSALDRLIALGRSYIRFATTHPAHYRLMFGAHMRAVEDVGELAPSGRMSLMRLMSLGEAVAEELGPPLDARRVSQVGWATVAGVVALVNERELEDEMTPDEVEALGEEALMVLRLGLLARARS
ncbi:MAG: TetR family transcriptional regulator [Deltaproteobacteria bacterium]|nr:MAG: TetR family transcriptional regulator [Deltaproteobacteria bacterium]